MRIYKFDDEIIELKDNFNVDQKQTVKNYFYKIFNYIKCKEN